MDTHPFVSVVIVNYNGKGFLRQCIESVLGSEYPDFEIVLVDNASTDGSIQEIRDAFGRDTRLRIVISERNLLYTGGYNTGIRNAAGELIVCLNNDTEVDRRWLTHIAAVMQDASIGAAVPKILLYGTAPQRIDYVGAGIDRYGFAIGYGAGEVDNGSYDQLRDVFYAGGTAMVLRRRVIEQVGVFDERFGMHWEETDLSWRIRLAGYRIVVIPQAKVYHKGSLTMKKFSSKPDVAWYIKKNRLAGLIKNYSLANVLTKVPFLIFVYAGIFLRELFVLRDARSAWSSARAVGWNIVSLPYLLRARRDVQRRIRIVTDKQIMRFMHQRSLAWEFICAQKR